VKEATWKQFHRKGYVILKRATAYLYTKVRSLVLALIKKRDEASKIFENILTKVFIASLIKGAEVISRL
jgi:hypothetical protein